MIQAFRNISLLTTCAALLSSCGSTDPQGQFVDSSANGKDSMSNAKMFILNEPPAKWESDWSTENTVVFHWRGEPDNLHPTNGASQPRMNVFDYTQRFLVRLDYETLKLTSDLCESLPVESSDGLTYSYTLKSGITWDDGKPLTADDVIFTLMANTCPLTNNPMFKPALEYLKSIEKDPANPLKFKMIMSEKYIQNVSVFTAFPILEEAYHDSTHVLRNYTFTDFLNPDFTKNKHTDVEAWCKEFNDDKYGHDITLLNGLGPYEVTEWTERTKLVLTRKKQHWTFNLSTKTLGDQAYPDQIILTQINEEAAIELGLKNQEIDVSCVIGTKTLALLQKDSVFNRNYHSAFIPNFDWQYIGFNMRPESVNRTPFFTDVKVRRAIALLIPRDEMNQAYLEGKALPMVSVVCPTRADAFNSDLKPLTLDVEGAKKLLDEAGWKDSDGDNICDKVINGKKTKFEFEFRIMAGSAVISNMANDIKNSLYLAGVVCNVKEMEGNAFFASLPTHDYDMMFSAWSGSSQTEDYKQLWHSSSWENGGSNYVGYSNPKADALIDKIRIETVDSIRIPMEKELQKIIYDDQPYVFMYLTPRKVVIHKRFGNAYMFWDKPGVCLSVLKLLSASTMTTTSR
jgi:peptide/nickel transport system substrate-binding protein